MIKTIFCFLFALFAVALISLGATIYSMGGFQHLDTRLTWETINLFLYATIHKLGIVSLCLTIIFQLLPQRYPRLPIIVLLGFSIAILYNYLALVLVDTATLESLYQKGWGFMALFNNFLLYYGLYGSLLALIGGMLALRIQKN